MEKRNHANPKMSKSAKSRGNSGKMSLCEAVKCPICNDRFTRPKTLPCLHTFCQKCLAIYVERYTQDNENPRPNSFPCPQCRAIAIPIDSTAPPATWAEQLPTNGIILSVIETMPLEETCQPCIKQNKESIRAVAWCKHCKIYLCITCTNYHNALFLDHETMSADQVICQPSILTNDEHRCVNHNQAMELVCRKCVHILTTDFFAKKLKSTREAEKLVEQFNDCLVTASNPSSNSLPNRSASAVLEVEKIKIELLKEGNQLERRKVKALEELVAMKRKKNDGCS